MLKNYLKRIINETMDEHEEAVIAEAVAVRQDEFLDIVFDLLTADLDREAILNYWGGRVNIYSILLEIMRDEEVKASAKESEK